MLIMSGIPSAHAYVTRNFGFDGCSWHSVADDGPIGWEAITETWDDNGGCSYLDADTKYFDDLTGEIETKWCNAVNDFYNRCKKSSWYPTTHHQSRSKAQSWETDRWQSSGWWG